MAAAQGGRVRCKGWPRTGSGPRGSSPKCHQLCAVGFPVALRGGFFCARAIACSFENAKNPHTCPLPGYMERRKEGICDCPGFFHTRALEPAHCWRGTDQWLFRQGGLFLPLPVDPRHYTLPEPFAHSRKIKAPQFVGAASPKLAVNRFSRVVGQWDGRVRFRETSIIAGNPWRK